MGENIRINKDIEDKTRIRILNKFVANFHATDSPFFVRVSVKTGMKAAVIAPSAKIRRCIFGILKATKKASADPEEPNAIAMTMSRKKPKNLDTRVMPLTVPAALLNFLLSSISGID